ncbi:50S ribosomal protein L25/general stress protein Ctc [Galbitalea sp. SE-J8]|uniref:50S ribosomal protein L25/general stress protein Ctc n=1 Tax=Galbitalea sp. SE-J8 TaxID=3054952 RepID=UPI00259CCD72|nr:50S ribosomal protein L25/general stress protein Ctc [Galbitalea sp. SE-J8]MDM4762789.1 50S ribosomal protein L25/general stress protein Ctc [Galbitalea sp. SE-J8]
MAKDVDTHLVSELRTQFGKGAARKIRAADKIPAVLYGHGTQPQHITLPGHETALVLRKANQVLELDIEGKRQLALVKDVQKDPVRQIIEHIDLLIVIAGEKVTVEVPVHVEGESAPGTIVALDTKTLSLEVEATHIPESVVVSVEGLEEGAHVIASAIELPTGATLISEADAVVVAVSVPAAAAGADDESAEAPSADAAAAAAE